MTRKDVLPTIWEVPDALWTQVEPVIQELDPPKRKGRKRVGQRKQLNGIIFRLRTGCQWNQLPKEFGDDSTVHRTFQRWVTRGVLCSIWALILGECEELGGVDWEWQAADGAMGKARSGGTKSVPTRLTERRAVSNAAFWSRPAVAL